MLAQHQRLARQDGRAAGDWLRRLARKPGAHPWLLLDQFVTLCPTPGRHQRNESS